MVTLESTPAMNDSCETALWPRLLGIVGGLGPLAHIEMERRLIRAVMERFKPLRQSLTDQLYPAWVVRSIPQTPDRTAALGHHGPSPVPMVLSALQTLKLCGCDYALIPCNTTHAWIREIKEASPLPVLDIVQATVDQAVRLCGAGAYVGLLGTDGTLESGIYSARGRATIDGEPRFISPLDLKRGRFMQNTVMDCIYGPIQPETGARVGGLKSGIHLDDQAARDTIEKALCLVIEQLADQGADAVILGCTELPLVLDGETVQRRLNRDIRLLDPMEVAAEVAIRIAAGEEALPS
jgi:aspartate racemase